MVSLYLPHHPIAAADIENLINQISKSYIILADFIVRSRLWRDRRVPEWENVGGDDLG